MGIGKPLAKHRREDAWSAHVDALLAAAADETAACAGIAETSAAVWRHALLVRAIEAGAHAPFASGKTETRDIDGFSCAFYCYEGLGFRLVVLSVSRAKNGKKETLCEIRQSSHDGEPVRYREDVACVGFGALDDFVRVARRTAEGARADKEKARAFAECGAPFPRM